MLPARASGPGPGRRDRAHPHRHDPAGGGHRMSGDGPAWPPSAEALLPLLGLSDEAAIVADVGTYLRAGRDAGEAQALVDRTAWLVADGRAASPCARPIACSRSRRSRPEGASRRSRASTGPTCPATSRRGGGRRAAVPLGRAAARLRRYLAGLTSTKGIEMKIGIIGSGRIGATTARLLAGAGHEVTIANSRGPESLGDLVGELGPNARAGTVEDAARDERRRPGGDPAPGRTPTFPPRRSPARS